VRRVIECDLEEVRPSVFQFRVRANAFLYRMVRIMAGAVTEVGSGRAPLEDLSTWLEGSDRPCAVPLPPHGLFLWKVAYPEELFIDDAGA
jgi:tRNA pseudouridine38-40 synthase